MKKIDLVHDGRRFNLEIEGTTISNVRSYEIKADVNGITTLHLEIVIPSSDAIVRLTS